MLPTFSIEIQCLMPGWLFFGGKCTHFYRKGAPSEFMEWAGEYSGRLKALADLYPDEEVYLGSFVERIITHDANSALKYFEHYRKTPPAPWIVQLRLVEPAPPTEHEAEGRK